LRCERPEASDEFRVAKGKQKDGFLYSALVTGKVVGNVVRKE